MTDGVRTPGAPVIPPPGEERRDWIRFRLRRQRSPNGKRYRALDIANATGASEGTVSLVFLGERVAGDKAAAVRAETCRILDLDESALFPEAAKLAEAPTLADGDERGAPPDDGDVDQMRDALAGNGTGATAVADELIAAAAVEPIVEPIADDPPAPGGKRIDTPEAAREVAGATLVGGVYIDDVEAARAAIEATTPALPAKTWKDFGGWHRRGWKRPPPDDAIPGELRKQYAERKAREAQDRAGERGGA